MGSATITFLGILVCSQVVLGGYVAAPVGSYYPTAGYYPTFVKQPVSVVQVQEKQPLQLRPPIPASPALPNTRPPVVAIHADPRPQQVQASLPVTAVQGLPVVAVNAQPLRKIVLPEPAVPSYSFGYAVKDTITGDEKSHEETRTGDTVVGRYTVVEPDGSLRTVTYTAGVNGFNAVVERTPGYAPPNAPAKVVAVAKPIAVSPIAISKPVAIAPPPAIAISRPVSVPVQAVSAYPPGFHFGG